jgi:transposase
VNLPQEDYISCPYPQDRDIMDNNLNKVCGIDVHKKFLVATVHCRDGTSTTERFSRSPQELFRFRDWVIENGCQRVAMESTGRLWIPIHVVLEGSTEVILANPYKIKHTPGKKTDIKDSEWIAQLCLNDMIDPSRIFPKGDRELRDLTRARESYIRDLTKLKNRVHQILDSGFIPISSVISDLFGKTGMYILHCLVMGKTTDEIIEHLPATRLLKKSDQIREALLCKLTEAQLLLLKGILETMASIEKRITDIEKEIVSRIRHRRSHLKIIMSVPGIGFIAAVTILAEIGNFMDFKKPEQLAAWAGLVPSVYQSADKLVTGKITKHGSRHLRWILVQVAQSIAHLNNSYLKTFFLRIRGRKGYNVAIVAVARKLICILHHLLVNNEPYIEDGVSPERKISFQGCITTLDNFLNQMDTIVNMNRCKFSIFWMDMGGSNVD